MLNNRYIVSTRMDANYVDDFDFNFNFKFKWSFHFQMNAEVQSWPYNFPASKDFIKADQRGTVSGRFMIRERYSLIINP